MRFGMRQSDGVSEVMKSVREQMRQGADHIKIMMSGGVASPYDPLDSLQFSPAEVAAAVQEATAFGRYVCAHAYTQEAITRAAHGGVRVIEHGNLIDDATAKLMAEKGMFMVANLVAYYAMKERAAEYGMTSDMLAKNDLVIDGGLRSLEICKRAGVPVGYGTDLLGALQVEESREFIIRSEVLSPIEIIRQATTIGARIVRQEGKIGTLKAGAYADLLLIDGDPLKNLGLFEEQGKHLSVIMKGGKFHKNKLTADPEKACPGRDPGWKPVFERSCSREKWHDSVAAHDGPARCGRRAASPRAGRALGAQRHGGALTLGFILLPLVLVTWLAFFRQEIPSFPPEGYSLKWFGAVLGNKNFVNGFLLSFQTGVVATLIGLALAVPASLAIARRRFRGRGVVSALLLMPLIVPGVVLGTSIYVFQIETEIATGLPLLGTTSGLIAAHVLIIIPWVARLVTASLASFDPAIEEAAKNLGATPWTTFWRVTLAVDPARHRGRRAVRLRDVVRQSRNEPVPGRRRAHHVADRDPAIPRMEDRSDRRGRLGDADRADRRRHDDHGPLREDLACCLRIGLRHYGAPRADQPVQALRRAHRGDGRDARRRGRRIPRAARALRLRQDHDLAHDRGLRRAERRRGAHRRQGRDLSAAVASQHRHGVPELRAVSAHDGGAERRLRAGDAQASKAGDREPRARGACAWCGSTATRSACRASCPAGSSSASRLPVRSRSGPTCCCSTSRCPISTPSCARKCASRSASCSASSA